MKIRTLYSSKFGLFSLLASIGMMLILVALQSCNTGDKSESEQQVDDQPQNVVDILTEAMEFQMPDTIPSGWYTWRYKNKSTQTHFILIDDYPDGITIDSVKQELLPVFGKAIELINGGNSEEGFAEFANLPKWFGQVKWPGGVGLISPEHVAQTTLKLDPGYYLVECYVKMNTGMWHTNMGMIKELVVSEEKSDLAEPTPDVSIELSSESGIVFESPERAGTYTFAVNFIDQIAYDHFLGHDINLVRIADGADLSVLEKWMDWRDPSGLREPAPEGFTFLGGVNDMPAGYTGYFTAKLEPGQYAFISEVPNSMEKNLLKAFDISE